MTLLIVERCCLGSGSRVGVSMMIIERGWVTQGSRADAKFTKYLEFPKVADKIKSYLLQVLEAGQET